MDERSPLLSLKNIDVTFTKRNGLFKPKSSIKVLSNISLDIYPGEVLALVGESGGGKTTIGNVITGLVRPSAGEMLYKGENVLALPNKQFDE
ncbi:MAG: ATP-binding cassette domain-containing protein, partial [Oscillospiraceae bacterium]|nr:ATP-binding cassette domain-containing protein [Oscillospiraceae bacterium]